MEFLFVNSASIIYVKYLENGCTKMENDINVLGIM